MAKQTIRLNESDFKRIVSEAVKNFLKEDTKAQRMKDPMNQWFKDMDRAQRLRDTMDYVTKGGKNPNKWNDELNEEAVGNGTDFEAVNKWVFWCFNWEPIENYAHIFKGAPKEHFIDKFINGCRGDMNRFYAELDTTNRAILVDYVMNNYKG